NLETGFKVTGYSRVRGTHFIFKFGGQQEVCGASLCMVGRDYQVKIERRFLLSPDGNAGDFEEIRCTSQDFMELLQSAQGDFVVETDKGLAYNYKRFNDFLAQKSFEWSRAFIKNPKDRNLVASSTSESTAGIATSVSALSVEDDEAEIHDVLVSVFMPTPQKPTVVKIINNRYFMLKDQSMFEISLDIDGSKRYYIQVSLVPVSKRRGVLRKPDTESDVVTNIKEIFMVFARIQNSLVIDKKKELTDTRLAFQKALDEELNKL